MEVRDEILCPAKAEFSTGGPTWEASVVRVVWTMVFDWKLAMFGLHPVGAHFRVSQRDAKTALAASTTVPEARGVTG